MAASVKHSQETNEQYTPVPVLNLVRRVLGDIALDPATTELANTRVRAKRIYTADNPMETFEACWRGRIFLNPPGGQRLVLKGHGFSSNPTLFWSKLMYSWHVEQTAEAAIFLGFTLEVFQSTQSVEEYPMLRFPFCVPKRRIAFDVPREEKIRQLLERADKTDNEKSQGALLDKVLKLQEIDEDLVPGDDPPHANALILVPPREEHFFGLDDGGRPWVGFRGPVTDAFQDVFQELGYVRI